MPRRGGRTTKTSCEARRKRRRGEGDSAAGWGRQRSEQDIGRNEATGAKDPAAPSAKDIVAENDGGKSAHGSRDEDGRRRNPPRQRELLPRLLLARLTDAVATAGSSRLRLPRLRLPRLRLPRLLLARIQLPRLYDCCCAATAAWATAAVDIAGTATTSVANAAPIASMLRRHVSAPWHGDRF